MTQAAKRETPDIETASEAYARRFAGRAGEYLLARQSAAVSAVLEDWSGGTVLDVGGAHAQLLPVLTAKAGRVLVFGSDSASFGRVRGKFPQCRAVAGDLLNLPFADRTFDLVAAVRLISHIDDWRRLVAEMCRVARRAVVIDYPRSAGFNALTPLLFPLKKGMEGNTRTYRNFSDAEIDDAFDASGFRMTRRYAQFALPMVIHRRFKGATFLRQIEAAATTLRVTHRWGSPVILRADRIGNL